ncbi:MAG: biotin-dependent carboxyltransferase family protein [Halioglobus sp.]
MSMRVLHGGVLSLLQDAGRFGAHRLGLTNGGPLDLEAFHYCNRLLQNEADCCVVEVSVGGLQLESLVDTWVCLTGAEMPLLINDQECERWCVHPVAAGDRVSVEYAVRGCRAYFGVAGGFRIAPYLGSASTVVREGVGGLQGIAVQRNDELPCRANARRKRLYLQRSEQPRYPSQATVRVIPGYQQRHFSRTEQRRFFGAPYTVTERSDRMGYRLSGSAVSCDINGVLSEGICHGAIQIPPDGQPIVLLNDRQTIGGYPKIGAALRPDAARLAQLRPGDTVHFAAVTPGTARRILSLEQRFTLRKTLREH